MGDEITFLSSCPVPEVYTAVCSKAPISTYFSLFLSFLICSLPVSLHFLPSEVLSFHQEALSTFSLTLLCVLPHHFITQYLSRVYVCV